MQLMPSPFGHLLAGLTIGWLAEPFAGRPRRAAAATHPWDATDRLAGTGGRFRPWSRFALLCAALAALPDVDLVYSPIHRQITHGIGAVFLIMIIAAAVTGWVTRKNVWRVALVCGAAYASHIVLDLLGRDASQPYGLRALWPFDDGWYISGWDVFPGTERRRIFSQATIVTNIWSVVREVLVLAPVVAGVWWIRKRPAR
jgi:membrane-bound metal-dependent hydrolase YbcI (DUF457 family)